MSEEQAPLEDKYGPVEEYAGGDIKVYHGIVNKWLLLVFAVLFVWALYYIMGPFEDGAPTFRYWGGLGPGLAKNGADVFGKTGVIAFGVVLAGVIIFFAWVAYIAIKK